jgi:uncharacterized protein
VEAATDYITTAPRIEQERRGCIRTFTGRYVNPLQLRAGDVCIEDIAHHLSNICRYTGACPEFYSVAQHSVYVSTHMWTRYDSAEAAMAGLLHDAAEAYLNDIASPVKHSPQMAWYRDCEKEAERVIFEEFRLDMSWMPKTKEFDDLLFRQEVSTFWKREALLTPISPRKAEELFMRRYRALREEMK